jgi:tetratricopeptide (TPR) repeat protein
MHTNSSSALDAMDELAWEQAAAALAEASRVLSLEQVDDAAAIAADALATLVRVVGDVHPDTANAIAVHGSIAWVRGDVAGAEHHFRAALAIYDRYLDDDDDALVVRPLRLATLERMGMLLSLRGAYVEAERMLREALADACALFGDDDVRVAGAHCALGVCLRFQGRYAEARASYQRSIDLHCDAGLPPSPTHEHNLSGLASAEGDFVLAERHARAAIALRRAAGECNAFFGTDLCGLGDALAGQERFAEAEQCYREGLALYAISCREHVEVAYALHNLGDTLASLQRADEAEQAYLDSIARKRRAFGHAHHEIAATMNNLAALYVQTGRMEEARTLSAGAMVRARSLDVDHPIRVGCEALATQLGAAVTARASTRASTQRAAHASTQDAARAETRD